MLVELNGSGSEPTHLYDPQHSLWQAWKIIMHHWHIMYIISKKNLVQGFTLPTYKQVANLKAQWKVVEKKLQLM